MDPLDLLAPDPTPRFGGPPPRNAYVELHNLIAAADSIDEFSPADRDRIARRHGVDLAQSFTAERAALYRAVLDHRLADGDFGPDDREALGHIARTLGLDPATLCEAHRRAFGQAVTDAVEDDCLSAEERLLLYKLQHALGLDPALADGAYDVLARDRLLRVVASALCDGELSPEEEAEIESARAALSLRLPAEVARMMDAARTRWQVRRGRLSEVTVPIEIADGEAGRLVEGGTWSFADLGKLEGHIGKGVLHSGRTGGLRLPAHVLRGRARAGRIVVTSRRLVLVPDDRGLPAEYRLDRVSQLLRFRNGTVIRTHEGRVLYVDPVQANDAFYAVLYRVVFEEATAPD